MEILFYILYLGKENKLDLNTANDENVSLIWHVKNKYYQADIRVYVSSDLVQENNRVPPVGAIIYYTDKIDTGTKCSTEKDNFIKRLEQWLNSHTPESSGCPSAESHNNDSDIILQSDHHDSEDVRLVVVENFYSEEIKSEALNWALNKGKRHYYREFTRYDL